jgi:hypothetical protein
LNQFIFYCLQASSIILGGEVAIPFLHVQDSESGSDSAQVTFTKYPELCMQFRSSCALLSSKSRLRGVKLILPKDLTVGDEFVSPSSIAKRYSRFDPEARDEGLEYEGESKILTLPADEAFTVDEYVYDIGPASVLETIKELENHHLILLWGTAGLCEVGSFQDGTKKIFDISAKRPWVVDLKAPPAVDSQISRHVMVIGESTNEWFLRFTDPDGSETKGDLVGAGVVAFAARNSVLFTGIMGCYKCSSLSRIVRRNTETEAEWIYNKRTVNIEEPEEEEDEEDEEDDE